MCGGFQDSAVNKNKEKVDPCQYKAHGSSHAKNDGKFDRAVA
jgi:hypothetical protein